MNKSRIILATFIMSALLTATGLGITLGYYGGSSDLDVGNIDIEFIGERQLKISESPTGFKETLTYDGNNLFLPVSSMYSHKWISEKASVPKFKRAPSGGNIDIESTYKETIDAEAGFYRKELYLYSDINCEVGLDKDLFKVKSNHEENAKTAKLLAPNDENRSEEEILHDLDQIDKSIRVSILNPDVDEYAYTIIDPYKEGETYLGGRLALRSLNNFDYYKRDNKNYEFLYGDYVGEPSYDEPLSHESGLVNPHMELSVFNSKTAKGVCPINFEKSKANGLIINKEDSLSIQDASDQLMIPLKAYEVKKIVISIYIEGWDLDNITQAMNGSFDVSVKFKIAKEIIK